MQTEHQHLAANHGVIGQAEALAIGFTKQQIQQRLRSNTWHRIGPRTYQLSGSPRTWLGSARGLALSTGGLLSHRAAARLWNIDGFEQAGLEVTVPIGVRRGASTNAGWHRSTQMNLAAATERYGVPCTGIGRTVIDLAGVVSLGRLREIVDEVRRRTLISVADLCSVPVTHARRGRPGVSNLRRLLEQADADSAVPDSRWNRMVWQMLVDAGLPAPCLEHDARDADGQLLGRIDLAYPHRRIGIELDSRRYHMNDKSFSSDRRRSNGLVNAGWCMLHFTWDVFADRPTELVSTVRQSLRPRVAEKAPSGRGVG